MLYDKYCFLTIIVLHLDFYELSFIKVLTYITYIVYHIKLLSHYVTLSMFYKNFKKFKYTGYITLNYVLQKCQNV